MDVLNLARVLRFKHGRPSELRHVGGVVDLAQSVVDLALVQLSLLECSVDFFRSTKYPGIPHTQAL